MAKRDTYPRPGWGFVDDSVARSDGRPRLLAESAAIPQNLPLAVSIRAAFAFGDWPPRSEVLDAR